MRAAWQEMDADDAARLDAEHRGSELRKVLDGAARVTVRTRTLPSPAVLLGIVAVLVLIAAGYAVYRIAPSSGTTTCTSAGQAQSGSSLQQVFNRCR